jgi:hypothetical protein
MREERGQIAADVLIAEPYTLWGSAGGTVTVIAGGKFYLRGAIYGDLVVEDGGRAHILGSVAGNLVVKTGAKVILSGTVGRNAVNEGGRLYIEHTGKVLGKTKSKRGKTEHRKSPEAGDDPDQRTVYTLD